MEILGKNADILQMGSTFLSLKLCVYLLKYYFGSHVGYVGQPIFPKIPSEISNFFSCHKPFNTNDIALNRRAHKAGPDI